MKTWSAMYALVWVAFLDILIGLFSPFGYPFDLPVHAVVGLAIIGLAFTIQRKVKSTDCPGRIKRITRVTWYLALLQVLLGAILVATTALAPGGLAVTVVVFVHAVNAIAIITQASSSATAFDMWEEKEFAPAQAASPA